VGAIPLGQQELAPPAPRREVRAFDGAYWWGVDPSVHRVAVAWCGEEQGVRTRSFAPGKEGSRLAHIYAETFDLGRELRRTVPPGFVWVEQPFAFGKPVPPVSYMVQGVIMAALHASTEGVVEAVKPPATWKALALGQGFGNARKPVVMEWARANGYAGWLQDEADALAMAVAASRAVGFV
jgi:Holliday junction resolvasome RuvABC endonuclease subunit